KCEKNNYTNADTLTKRQSEIQEQEVFVMQFKKVVGLAAAATMMLAMSATAFAADGDVYAKFCKDGQGSGSVSMVQKAVAGKSEVTVDEAKDCYKITIPVKVFTHSMGSFSGTGQLTSLTV